MWPMSDFAERWKVQSPKQSADLGRRGGFQDCREMTSAYLTIVTILEDVDFHEWLKEINPDD
jgi:hypothetical protein